MNNVVITKSTTEADLLPVFTKTPYGHYMVALKSDNHEVVVTVNFTNNSLDSLSIQLPAIDNDFDNNILWDYYQKVHERKIKYEKWLHKHLTAKTKTNRIQIGADKSENVFIVLMFNVD